MSAVYATALFRFVAPSSDRLPVPAANWYASSMMTAVEPWSGHYPTDDADLSVVYATARECRHFLLTMPSPLSR